MNGIGSKAIAGTSGLSLGAAMVAVMLYYLNSHPPQEIVLALGVLVSAPLTYAAVFFAPHNASEPPVPPTPLP